MQWLRFLVGPIVFLFLLMLLVSGQGDYESDEVNHIKRDYESRKKICIKKPSYGKCKGQRKMWYFNIYRNRCETFTYSNCGGNRNRFFSQPDCTEYCMLFNFTMRAPEFRR